MSCGEDGICKKTAYRELMMLSLLGSFFDPELVDSGGMQEISDRLDKLIEHMIVLVNPEGVEFCTFEELLKMYEEKYLPKKET